MIRTYGIYAEAEMDAVAHEGRFDHYEAALYYGTAALVARLLAK